jgi:hypothetical protein
MMVFEGVAGDMVSHFPGKTGVNIRHTTIRVWATIIKLAGRTVSYPCIIG